MITNNHVAKLWVKMVRIYGHKWRSNFGDADDGTWLTGLRHLTPEQLTRGLVACMTSGEAWPPSLPEFRSLCLGVPKIEIMVQDALSQNPGKYGARLQRMIDSYSRDSMTRAQLAGLYRAKAIDLVENIQIEKTGAALSDDEDHDRVLRHIR